MACISRALIVGGGIAGLASAIALQKVGVRCDVVEIAFSHSGWSLGLSGRAVETLVELGIYDECCETGRSFDPGSTALTMSDATGKVISAGPQRPSWPGSKSTVGVYRPEFLRILNDAAERAGAAIRHGVTTETIETTDESSKVVFTDGTEGAYDLIVGADGISSSTRRLLFPEAGKPIYAGQMSIRWMAPGAPIPDEGWFISSLGRLGFYYLPGNVVYVAAVIDAPQGTWLEGEKLYDVYSRLLDSFTAPPVVELRRRLTPDSKILCRPFEWILVQAPWYKGRTLLIGDAAHATTAHMGMGGGMALEDAVVLGQCIAAAPTLQEALSQFMERRYDRVRSVVDTSVALSQLEQRKAPPSENVGLLTAALQSLAKPY